MDVQTLGDTKLHFHFSHPYLRQSQNMPLKEYLESKTPKDINPLVREIKDSLFLMNEICYFPMLYFIPLVSTMHSMVYNPTIT